MSLGSAAAAAIMLETLCKLISPYQHCSAHPHRAAPTTPASAFLMCVLRPPNAGFGYLLQWKRQGEGCMPCSEHKTLRFEVAISSWVISLLNVGLASTAALLHACVNITLITESSAMPWEHSCQRLALGPLRGWGTRWHLGDKVWELGVIWCSLGILRKRDISLHRSNPCREDVL